MNEAAASIMFRNETKQSSDNTMSSTESKTGPSFFVLGSWRLNKSALQGDLSPRLVDIDRQNDGYYVGG
jgi:hypothetical protein